MSAPGVFGFQQLMTELLRGLAQAVAERPGETDSQRFARHQTAVFSAMAFMPRDAVETMLANQCVIFDHLLRDGTRDLLRGQSDRDKIRIRPQLVAIGKSFLNHLEQLRLSQLRPVEQIAMPPAAAATPDQQAAAPQGRAEAGAAAKPPSAAAHEPAITPRPAIPTPGPVVASQPVFLNRQQRREALRNGRKQMPAARPAGSGLQTAGE
jgi:hypothetical protein